MHHNQTLEFLFEERLSGYQHGGPFSKHSFSDDDSLLDLANASYTAFNLFGSDSSLKIDLCRR